VYNPGKITKYGILVWMVCESSTGYICNLQIYDGKCGPLTETVGFLLEPYEGKGYHLYQDNYYNSVRQTNELLQKLIRVCGTIRLNRGLPKDMIEEAKKLKKGEVTFRRDQEILLISHQDKRLVNMISTLHTAEVVETTNRRTGVVKKKPRCIMVLTHLTTIWLTTHSFAKLSSGLRKCFSIFSSVAFSTVMLPFQRIIPIPANHS